MTPEEKRERRQRARERLRRLRERARQRALATDDAANNGPASTSPSVKPAGKSPGRDTRSRAGASQETRSSGTSSTERQQHRQAAIDALERDAAELNGLASPTDETSAEIARIHARIDKLKSDLHAQSDAWRRLQMARHPQRPYTDDFIRLLFEDFSEIHGDRQFADDAAIVTGMARFHGKPVLIVGTQKGRDTKQRLARNFGQARPEGYRKALRAMRLAAKFARPIFVFIDTQGAYPGIGAEERGQAEAIARNIREMSHFAVPIIATITGEGGSGGALALAVGDRVFMLENSVYSVISPEGCASILWRDANKAEIAAEALKITPTELLQLKLVDGIVPEPEEGAHTDYEGAAKLLDPVLAKALEELSVLTASQLLDLRYEKYRHIGQFFA